MKMLNRSVVLINTMTFALFVFVLAGTAAAQGRYANQYSRADVDNVIRNVEDRADEFRRDFYAELERGNLGGSQERGYRNQVTNFENATDRLRRNFDSDNTWWRSRSQVQNVISSAMPLNNTMNSIAFRRRIERQWNQLRNAVNRLAETYDLPGIAGGGWNGGPGNPGGPGYPDRDQTRPPAWAQGTFYGNAYDGTRIRLTISPNGSATADIGGSMSYGSYLRGNLLRVNEAVSRVTRQGDGFATTRTDNGERIVYSRSEWVGGDDNAGEQVSPPDWARGTFYGRAADGTRITLTIRNNGEVTANIGGSRSFGSFLRGNYLRMNEALARVVRSGNGFSTTRTDNGEVIYYTR